MSLDAASIALFADMVRDHLRGGGMVLAATHMDLGLDAAVMVNMGDFGATLTPAAGAAPAPAAADDDPFLGGDWR